MGSKKAQKFPVADYAMTIHYGICYGVLDSVNKIFVKELPVWCGKLTEPGTISVDLPELFGGDTSEGGVRGVMDIYFGSDTQIMSAETAAQYDLTPTTMPGYRQLANIMFRGATDDVGFKWNSNNPYLPGAWINGTRIPKQLSTEFAVIYPNGRDYTETVADVPSGNSAVSRDPVAMGALAEDIDAGLVTYNYAATGSFSALYTGDPLTGAVQVQMHFYDEDDSEIAGSAVFLGGVVTGGATITADGALPAGTRRYTVALIVIPTFPIGAVNSSGRAGSFSYPSNGPSWCATDGSLASLPQANPAHMIFEAITDSDLGMGGTAEDVDIASFMYAAETFYNEGFGLTAFWSDQSEVESYCNEIINHVQAALFLSPTTGLWTLVPYRADYDINTIPVLDETNCTLENNQRKGLGETVNEIVISWTNPDTEEPETLTFQDPGNIAAQGALVSTTRPYYMIRHERLANKVGARDIRAASYPLYATDAYVDRSLRGLHPGSVVKLNWEADGIVGMAMRVGEIDYGQPGDSKIKLALTEDIFGLESTTYTTTQRSLWLDESLIAPTPMTYVDFMTAPLSLFLRAGNSITDIELADYPLVPVVVLAKRDGGGAVSTFSLAGQGFLPNGDPTTKVLGKLPPTPSGTTTAVLAAEPDSVMAAAEVSRFLGANAASPGMFIKLGLGDVTSELVMLDVYDSGAETWTVARGMFDTIPRRWPVGTRGWYLGDFLIPVDPSQQNDGVEVTYRLLPTSSGGTLALADSTPYEFTPTARPYCPIRPANVKATCVPGASSGAYPIVVQNGGAETHATLIPTLWDSVVKVNSDTTETDGDGGSISPHSGSRFFRFGGTGGDDASMEQTLLIPPGFEGEVDAGDLTLEVRLFLSGRSPEFDPVRIDARFYSAAGTLLSSVTAPDLFPIGAPNTSTWTERKARMAIPANARYYVLRVRAFKTGAGAQIFTYADTITAHIMRDGFETFAFVGTEVPPTLDLTWANRNSLSEDVIAPRWTGGNVTPEVGQTTTIRAVDRLTGTVEFEATGLTGTSYSLDTSELATYQFYDIQVWSVRDGFESIQAFAVPVQVISTGYGFGYGFAYGG